MTLTANTTVVPSPAKGLVCRNCGATFGLIAEHACAECFGPLEVDYDHDLLRAVTREQIEAGPQNIWRYAPLLPVGQDPASRVSLNPGMTRFTGNVDGLPRTIELSNIFPSVVQPV